LPESFVRQVEAETVYISDLKNKARDAIKELEKLSKYIEIMEIPDEYFTHMQGHETELSLVLSAFSLNSLKETIIQALEKQMPKKPREHYNWVDLTEEERPETSRWYCKMCDSEIKENYSFCVNCGQKLNWN